MKIHHAAEIRTGWPRLFSWYEKSKIHFLKKSRDWSLMTRGFQYDLNLKFYFPSPACLLHRHSFPWIAANLLQPTPSNSQKLSANPTKTLSSPAVLLKLLLSLSSKMGFDTDAKQGCGNPSDFHAHRACTHSKETYSGFRLYSIQFNLL